MGHGNLTHIRINKNKIVPSKIFQTNVTIKFYHMILGSNQSHKIRQGFIFEKLGWQIHFELLLCTVCTENITIL